MPNHKAILYFFYHILMEKKNKIKWFETVGLKRNIFFFFYVNTGDKYFLFIHFIAKMCQNEDFGEWGEEKTKKYVINRYLFEQNQKQTQK